MIYIFGYGSLVNSEKLKAFLGVKELHKKTQFTYIRGYSRSWDVAMDNSINLPNYKFYISKDNQERENIFVSFLNIQKSPQKSVYGILFPIEKESLPLMDKRERNYNRVNITGSISNLDSLDKEDIVYTYIGKKDANERYRKGKKENRVFVSKDYYDDILSSFKKFNGSFYDEYLKSFSDSPKLKVLSRKSSP